MTTRYNTKLVHEGQYIAEVDVKLIYSENEWAPYLSIEDAYKLDDVRNALRRKDLKAASSMSRVYKMTPVAV